MLGFGYQSFAPLFAHNEQRVPPYLHLLNLMPGADASLMLVQQGISISRDRVGEILKLLNENDWRPHLVAACAIALGVNDTQVLDAAWMRFDEGSWVSPQLAVAAFIADSGFAQNVRGRIEARCPIQVRRSWSLGSMVRHVAMGPSGDYNRSCKALGALLGLASRMPLLQPWAEDQMSTPDVEQMLRDDWDDGFRLAPRWLDTLRATAGAAHLKLVES